MYSNPDFVRAPGAALRDLREACEHLRKLNFEPEMIIDVGVAWGTPDIYDVFQAAELVLIEPIAVFYPALEALLARRSGRLLKFAASDAPDNLTIETENDAASLASASLNHVAGSRWGLKNPVRFDVEVRTLDDLLPRAELKGPILLKTDCQGFDRRVLSGASEVLGAVDVVIAETSVFGVHGSEQNMLVDLISDMRDRGFVLYDIVGALYRDHDEALAQVDVVFVRQDHPLLSFKGW